MKDANRQQLFRHLDRARSAVGMNWSNDATRQRLQDLANELHRQGITPQSTDPRA